MYYQEIQHKRNDRLGFALFMAGCLHLAVILGVGFEASLDANIPTQLAVTLTNYASTEPVEAEHIASANQDAGGEQAERDRVTSTQPPAASVGDPEPLAPPPQSRAAELPSDATVVTSTSRALQQHQESPGEKQPRTQDLDGISPEVARLSQQLANLQAELDAQDQAYARLPKVRRLTSLAAQASEDAAYLHAWRTRVEAVGNQYYPEASIRYGIYGSLRLLVVIRQDGSLEDIQVLSSSGYAVLDEAAIKIVRLAAPFAPFSDGLRATADKLEIIRTWQFQENRLSSG